MGVIREADTPVVLDDNGTVLRMTEVGDMTVELDVLEPDLEISHLFKGLPDDCCQAEHWGYVIEGEIRYEMHEGEDVVAVAGDAYYVPPGHLPHSGSQGAKVVEFSKTAQLARTMQIVELNMEQVGR